MAGKIRYWKERNGRYSARIVVPPRLRPFLPPPDTDKSELEVQLGGDRRTAIRKHAAAVATLQYKIGLAEQKANADGKAMASGRYPLSVEEIARREYEAQIEFDAEIRQHDHRYAMLGVDVDRAQRLRDGFSGSLSDDELEELVGDRIARLQTTGNTSAAKGSPKWRATAQALCLANYEAMARQDERDHGDFTGRPSHPMLAGETTEEESAAPITFDDIIDAEVKLRARGKNAKPLPDRTVKKYRDAAVEFATFRNSKNAAAVTAVEGKNWIEAMQDAGHLGNRTVKMKFQNVRTVLNWGRQNDPENFLPTGNPLTGIKTPDYTTTPSYLRAFTMDEAKVVLAAARKETKQMLRWIPWLCAYSGMRVSEAASLRKEDFFKVGDRWFWKVTTAGNRSLKNASSERRIPVHKALVAEGLVELVERADAGRLFRGESKEEINVQPRISSWVRELVPFEKRPELSPNHGWRHLFEDLCRRDGMQDDARNYLTGRTSGHSHEHYGRSEVMLPGLADAMDRIKPIPIA
ncbi:integrase [Nitratireductor luteus]|uniref:integrase n=1 Tax=Nitratireductor luteus TaxID=2976980 RepID=UPI00223F0A17|nr:integrase [Nitratireductor luteus]